jgi:hypothetical protein
MNYQNKIAKDIRDASKNDPKIVWQIINKCSEKRKTDSDIPLETTELIFSTVTCCPFLCWMSSKLVISHMFVSLLSWIKQSIHSSEFEVLKLSLMFSDVHIQLHITLKCTGKVVGKRDQIHKRSIFTCTFSYETIFTHSTVYYIYIIFSTKI